MKKQILFLFAALFLGLAATAQTVSFDLKAEGKGTNKTDSPQFIGCDNQRIVLVESTGLIKTRLSLVSYSLDQQELARVELGSGKETSSYGGYINGQYVDLLRVDQTEDSKTKQTSMRVYRDRRKLTTLQPEGEPLVLGNYTGEKGDDFGFGISVSPNGELLAGVFVARYAGQGTEIKVSLYNHELEEYWTMSPTKANFNMVHVTDDGDVILYALNDNGECSFTILDGEKESNIEFTIRPDEGTNILERAFVRYGNGKIILATAVREENHVIMPVGSNMDRVDIHCYNINRHHLSCERHTFTDQETQRLCNQKEGSSPRHHWVQFGEIAQTLADKDGGYVMIDQVWTVTVNGSPSERHRCGMMVLRVDADGKILWTRTNRFSATSQWPLRHLLTHRWMATPQGVMLTWVDHASNVSAAPSKPYKEYKPGRTKSALNVWIVGPDGKETQSYILTGKNSLAGAAHRLDTPGKYVALLSSLRKGQLAFFTIE